MQEVILRGMLDDNDYFKKVYPYLKPKHFKSLEAQEVFKAIDSYVKEFGIKPNKKELALTIKGSSKINDKVKEATITFYKTIVTDEKIENKTFLLNETEKYIQKVEMTDAILSSADVIKKDGEFEKVLGFVSDALKIRFDSDIGMNYNDSLEDRLEYYHKKSAGISCGIESIDKILGGGFKPKTLNVIGAPSHVGKSLGLISITAAMSLKGKKVLFLPLEMSEEEIGKRLDANILDIDSNTIKDIPLDELRAKFNAIKPHLGKTMIKEYPSGALTTFKVEALLDELFMNHEFMPDAIVIDYLTLMGSSRATLAQAGGTYSYYKLIAEELHGLAKKLNIPIITAAQLNRSAYGNKEAGLETIADSLGIVQTADVFIAMISDDVLKANGRMYWKFLKNRNTGMLYNQLLGINYTKSRFYDIEESEVAAENIKASMGSEKGTFNRSPQNIKTVKEAYNNDSFNTLSDIGENRDFSMLNL